MVIRTGIGGWTHAEWRDGTFFPAGLVQRRELEFASRALRAIEVNGTFYRLQKPESFRQWREETPEGFIFTLKGSRFVTNRKELASAREGIENFMRQGLTELGDRLGPICWQLATTKRFDPDELGRFLDLLPGEWDGLALRHALEVGHESFSSAEFVRLMRERNVAIVFSDQPQRIQIADRTADFAYLRLQGMQSDCPTGYPLERLAEMAEICREWAAGKAPPGLDYAGEPDDSRGQGGDVFAFMINGAKERAPAAAIALAGLLERRR